MKINTREHTIVEPSSTKGDICFRERFFSIIAQKKEEERKKQNMDNEQTFLHTADRRFVLIRDEEFMNKTDKHLSQTFYLLLIVKKDLVNCHFRYV
jgi:Ca2+-dependent lipid-binding protein